MTENTADPIGNCEVCGTAIMPGDLGTDGGMDPIWLCLLHSPMLKDQIKQLQGALIDGTWADVDYGFDDKTSAENYLIKLESELFATGNRSLATVQK